MKLEYGLDLKQTQKLAMTPKMIQEIQILQYNVQELDSYIQEQIITNPVLEPEEIRTEEAQEPSEELLAYIREKGYEDVSYKRQNYDREDKKEPYEYHKVADIILPEHLNLQLQLASKNKECLSLGKYIIETIDENGYMTSTEEEISRELKVPLKYVKKVASLIRTFDPSGVGALNLRQCLLIQLENLGNKDKNLEEVIRNHLEDLAENRLSLIGKKLGISAFEVQSIGDTIKTLDPRPGRQFSTQDEIRYIIPDIILKNIDGKYVATLNNINVPHLMISSYYKKLLNEAGEDKALKEYLNERINSALWLIKCIEQRHETILNVVNSIVAFQEDFFTGGEKYLKPLTLKKVAQEVGVHESTISRAINGKYIQHANGVYELKYFFSSGIGSVGEGDVSSNSIKAQIKELIENEDTKKPLSDQKIADILLKKGFDISRRTVTKYRESMDISSSSKRRRY